MSDSKLYKQMRGDAHKARTAFLRLGRSPKSYANFTPDELTKVLQDRQSYPVVVGNSGSLRRAPLGTVLAVCCRTSEGYSVRIFWRGAKFWHGFTATAVTAAA